MDGGETARGLQREGDTGDGSEADLVHELSMVRRKNNSDVLQQHTARNLSYGTSQRCAALVEKIDARI